MTISNTSRVAGPFLGNGTTTDFPFGFKVFGVADMLVVKTIIATGVNGPLVLNLDYYVILNQDQNANPGGIIKVLQPPTSGTSVVITSNMPITQTLDLTNSGGFYPAVINSALDRVVILIQQIASTLRRTLRFPLNDGGTIGELPSAATRANNILGFDANGDPIAVTISLQSAVGVALSLATAVSNYAAAGGASLIGYMQSSTGSILRTLSSKLGEVRSVMDKGAIGDDVHDDLAAFQKCADLGGAWFVPDPAVAYRFSNTLMVTRPVRFYGDGANALQDLSNPTNGTVINTRGTGPWLHFDHKGVGVKVIPQYFIDGVSTISALCDITFTGMGSFRNQPLPVTGSTYAPDSSIDWDFVVQDCFFNMDDFTFLNPTKAAQFRLSRFGHCSIGKVRGQPLQVGFDFDNTYGEVILGDVIWSKFWTFAAEVATYQLANTIGLRTGRVDGLDMKNYTANGHNICWQLVNTGAGVTGARCNKLYSDTGMIGVQVGVAAAGVSISVDELNIYGGGTGSVGMQIYADDFRLSAATTLIENISDYTFNITGKRARLNLGALSAKNWSLGRTVSDGRALFSTTVAVDTIIRFNSIDTRNNVDGLPFWQDGVAGLNNNIIGKIGGGAASYARDGSGVISIPYRTYLTPANPADATYTNSFPRPRSAAVSLVNPGAALLPYVIGISDTQLLVEVRSSTTGAAIGAGGSALKWDLYA